MTDKLDGELILYEMCKKGDYELLDLITSRYKFEEEYLTSLLITSLHYNQLQCAKLLFTKFNLYISTYSSLYGRYKSIASDTVN